MLGIFATADIIAKTSGKNAAIKMRKIAGLSPIWNHRMAKGIHASGERKRKKLSIGKKARLEAAFCPNHKPTGIASPADKKNPTATRHSDAMISLISLPAIISSLKLFNTSSGEGNAYDGKILKLQRAHQIKTIKASTTNGETADFMLIFLFKRPEPCEFGSSSFLIMKCIV